MANGNLMTNKVEVLTKQKLGIAAVVLAIIGIGAASILLGTSMAGMAVLSSPSSFKIAGKGGGKPVKEVKNYSVNLEQGTCQSDEFIFLPSSEIGGKYKMVSDLVNYIPKLETVGRLNGQGGWQSYVVPILSTDFALQPGDGYLIGTSKCRDKLEFVLPGIQEESASINLSYLDYESVTPNEFMLPASWQGKDVQELCDSIGTGYVNKIVGYSATNSKKPISYDCGSNYSNFNLSTAKAVIAFMVQSRPWPLAPGSLSASLSTSVPAETVISGTQQHRFADIILDATQSSEDILVKQITITVQPTNAAANELASFKIYYGDEVLQVTNDPDAELSGVTGVASPSTSIFTNPVLVSKGASKAFSVKANVSRSTAEGDVFAVGLQPDNPIDAVGVSSGFPVTVDYTYGDGSNMMIADSGELFLSRSAVSPRSGLLPSNTSGITVGVLNAVAQYEEVEIRKIYLTAEQINFGGWDQIDSLHIYDGSTLIASRFPTATDPAITSPGEGIDRTMLIDITNNPLVVPKDASKDFTFKVDTAQVDGYFGSKGEAGQGFKLKIVTSNDVDAVGADSARSITPSLFSTTFNSFTLYKSIPTIATNEDLYLGERVLSGTLPTGYSSNKDLYRFKVTANSAGDIALYQVSYYLSVNTASTSNLVLYDGTENVAASSEQIKYMGQKVIEMKFTNDGQVPDSGNSNIMPYTVRAGTSDSITLRGELECTDGCSGSTGSGTVNIQFLADGSVLPTYLLHPLTTYPYPVHMFDDIADFIWSDLNMTRNVSHPDVLQAPQWTNSYLVPKAGGGVLQPTSTAVSFTR